MIARRAAAGTATLAGTAAGGIYAAGKYAPATFPTSAKAAGLTSATTTAAPTSLEGTKVYRVWGDGAGPYGRSWTPVNPASVPNYRSAAGLPVQNTGRFVTEGVITDATGVTTRGAIPLHGNPGGLPEIVVPNPSTQIKIIRVGGVNPEF